jgi:hypothetical protein
LVRAVVALIVRDANSGRGSPGEQSEPHVQKAIEDRTPKSRRVDVIVFHDACRNGENRAGQYEQMAARAAEPMKQEERGRSEEKRQSAAVGRMAQQAGSGIGSQSEGLDSATDKQQMEGIARGLPKATSKTSRGKPRQQSCRWPG